MLSISVELSSLTLPNMSFQKDSIWKIQYKFFCHKNNVCYQILNEIKKGYLISSIRTLSLLCQVRACMSIYKTYMCCILIYLHMYIKKRIINMQCVQIKCISRLFGQTVSRSLNVPFYLLRSKVPPQIHVVP